MNVHLEIFLRVLALFLSTFFTTKWTISSKPKYDTLVCTAAVLSAIWINMKL